MKVEALASLVVQAIDHVGIDYILVGSFSSGYYGIPRATKDVDIVISIQSQDPVHTLEKRLKGVVTFDPQITFETITGSRRQILTSVGRPPTKVELFELGDDLFILSRFGRRRRHHSRTLGCDVWLRTAEDVIIQKLRWARSKDLDDARDVLAVQGEESLDMAYIEKRCQEHGTLERLRAIQASIPHSDFQLRISRKAFPKAEDPAPPDPPAPLQKSRPAPRRRPDL